MKTLITIVTLIAEEERKALETIQAQKDLSEEDLDLYSKAIVRKSSFTTMSNIIEDLKDFCEEYIKPHYDSPHKSDYKFIEDALLERFKQALLDIQKETIQEYADAKFYQWVKDHNKDWEVKEWPDVVKLIQKETAREMVISKDVEDDESISNFGPMENFIWRLARAAQEKQYKKLIGEDFNTKEN